MASPICLNYICNVTHVAYEVNLLKLNLLLFFNDVYTLDYAKALNNKVMICLNQGHNVFGCNDAQKVCELVHCEILGAAKSTAVSLAFSNF
jgi:hypothetical protein